MSESDNMEHERTPVGLVLALWAAGLGAAGQFAKISVQFSFLQDIYPEAGVGLGFLVSLISFLGIGLGLFAGLIVTRLGFRRMLIPALLLGGLISCIQALMPSLPILLVSRVIEGASHLVIVVAAPTLIGQVSAPQHRAAAMTLWSTFFGVDATKAIRQHHQRNQACSGAGRRLKRIVRNWPHSLKP
ncbi:MFS transporter [Aliiruegeria lutimaris]|uniref:Major Facilitator Superfamily protein n=1 Tax=Aliiruegeria lutimaris TaxID=571298 RepID=A0A1G9P8E8_9RHOB|nr:MFS transporter [Aliiruegeria lutimaris]SDL95030.1 Major Facilitator Superfamily protein [Aliiruegeria lutimaris]